MERLGLAEEEEAAGPEREGKFASTVCCAFAPKYMRVLRETSRSTFEIGGSLEEVVAAEDDRAANVAAHGRPAVAVFEVLGPEILRDPSIAFASYLACLALASASSSRSVA